MAFIIKDKNPQYGGESYMVGTRQMRDPHGQPCEAADFGERANAMQMSRDEAHKRVRMLNQMAGREQFVVEEVSVYGQSYGRPRGTNGYMGMGQLPQEQPAHGGFVINDNGYNGF